MALKPILFSVTGVGIVGGGVAGGYYYFKPNKIEKQTVVPPKQLRQELEGSGFEALNIDEATDDTTWGKLVEKYFTENNTTKIAIVGGTITRSSDNNASNITLLKKACKTLLEKISNSETDKAVAKNWCNKNSPLIPSDAL